MNNVNIFSSYFDKSIIEPLTKNNPNNTLEEINNDRSIKTARKTDKLLKKHAKIAFFLSILYFIVLIVINIIRVIQYGKLEKEKDE